MIKSLKVNNININVCNSTIELIELTSNIIAEELNKGLCIIPGGRTPRPKPPLIALILDIITLCPLAAARVPKRSLLISSLAEISTNKYIFK